MGFAVKESRQEHFEDIWDTINFASEEQERVYRLPLSTYLKQGARFTNDSVFGNTGEGFCVNEYGFDALCRLVGVNPYFLMRLQEQELASRILNDVLLSGDTSRPLKNLELVCDEETKQIIGIVSDKYVGYSNRTFLDDVLSTLDFCTTQKSLFPETGNFDFLEAYSVNTRLFVRIKSKHVVGTVKGRGGQGEDRSEIGLEFSNSMAGGHAVRLAYFVHRLICANGLIAKVASADGRLVHSGDENRFREKLRQNTKSLMGRLENTKEMIETLGAIPFDAEILAKNYQLKDILAIIADAEQREDVKGKLVDKRFSDIDDNEAREIARNAYKIYQLPRLIGGPEAQSVFRSLWRDNATMYDFVNIFTALAQKFDYAKRIQTEEKAGDLANWITWNKKKFM